MAAQPNRRTPTPPPSRRPLLVTCDAYLLDELVRIAARVNVLLDVAPDVPSARLAYATAPLVLVGVDLAQACVRAGLTRRRALVLVGRHQDDGPPDWPIADELAAEHIAALPAAEPWLAKRLADAGRRAALPAEPAAEPPVRAVPRLATGSRARVGADWP
ncbi:MAG TPA: septum site-determining protein minD, partial [Rugosimonospora sp.]|nr:septum site-determining protein minD [Rugosimonospora sp.]